MLENLNGTYTHSYAFCIMNLFLRSDFSRCCFIFSQHPLNEVNGFFTHSTQIFKMSNRSQFLMYNLVSKISSGIIRLCKDVEKISTSILQAHTTPIRQFYQRNYPKIGCSVKYGTKSRYQNWWILTTSVQQWNSSELSQQSLDSRLLNQ